MAIFGLCLLLAVILFLIDKNHQWLRFWTFLRRSAVVMAVVALIAFASFYLYQRHQNAKVEALWTPVNESSITASTPQTAPSSAQAPAQASTAVQH